MRREGDTFMGSGEGPCRARQPERSRGLGIHKAPRLPFRSDVASRVPPAPGREGSGVGEVPPGGTEQATRVTAPGVTARAPRDAGPRDPAGVAGMWRPSRGSRGDGRGGSLVARPGVTWAGPGGQGGVVPHSPALSGGRVHGSPTRSEWTPCPPLLCPSWRGGLAPRPLRLPAA